MDAEVESQSSELCGLGEEGAFSVLLACLHEHILISFGSVCCDLRLLHCVCPVGSHQSLRPILIGVQVTENAGLRTVVSKAQIIDELENTLPGWLKSRGGNRWYPPYIHILKVGFCH